MTIEALRQYGANVDEGLERCMGMEDFYLEMIELGLTDERFESLGSALESGDHQQAFELVHALKGVIGNLALEPLYETIVEMTEHLRAKEDIDYMPIYDKLIMQKNEIINLK